MFQKLKERRSKKDSLIDVKGMDLGILAPSIPDGLFRKCEGCQSILDSKTLRENLDVCPSCKHHHRMHIVDRACSIFDSFKVFNHRVRTVNPLDFPGYTDKLETLTKAQGVYDAVVCAEAVLDGKAVIAVIMDPSFMMGSMGSVVGEKITRSFERALKQKKPIVLFSASGGARMQEGIMSLMQMAKTSGAVGKFNQAGGFFINILTDPTTGGVTASFAMLADIILAEPGALIGFAGPRVIEQTMRKPLPEGFQSAEFLLEHGFVDKIVARSNLKETLSKLLELHGVSHGK